jgi:hypothetical protein
MQDVRFQLRFSREQRAQIAALAVDLGISSADLVRMSVACVLRSDGALLRPGNGIQEGGNAGGSRTDSSA